MNIVNPFRRIRIRPRIYAGFFFVVAMVVVVSALGYRSADKARGHFQDLEQVRDRATAILELDRAVGELQRHVENYTHTGHASVAERVQLGIEDLSSRLQTVQVVVTGPRERMLLKRMAGHFGTYRETFTSAVTERELRAKLVQEATDKTLAEFSSSALQVREREPANRTLLALEAAMLAAEMNLYRYLYAPQYSLLLEANKTLDTRLESFEQSAVADLSPESVQARAPVLGSVQQFQRTFTRIVQATRSYLYLIGVVMAGEAQEFRHVSSELRDYVLMAGKPISDRIAQTTVNDQRTASLASLIAVILALLISGLIARSISKPITRMTATFEALAAGEKDAVIPESDRPDEIGVMAQAANVFREKNQETERLLEQARELTQELDEHKQELERSNGEMEQFVYTVSHDLKSPIVTSLGFIGMMRKLAKKGMMEKAMSKLDTLEKANKRMSQLIEDLLDLSRVGRVDMDLKVLDMNRLVADLLSSLSKKLRENQVRVDVAGDLPSLRANESRVLQVFDNLLGNAVKYAVNEDEGCEVEIGGMEVDGEIRFFVRDNGPGIAPDFHERVFGLFQRLQPSGQGTGIGLAIVMKVMQFHEGRVWIESSGTGDGACFWLAFPAAQQDEIQGAAA